GGRGRGRHQRQLRDRGRAQARVRGPGPGEDRGQPVRERPGRADRQGAGPGHRHPGQAPAGPEGEGLHRPEVRGIGDRGRVIPGGGACKAGLQRLASRGQSVPHINGTDSRTNLIPRSPQVRFASRLLIGVAAAATVAVAAPAAAGATTTAGTTAASAKAGAYFDNWGPYFSADHKAKAAGYVKVTKKSYKEWHWKTFWVTKKVCKWHNGKKKCWWDKDKVK